MSDEREHMMVPDGWIGPAAKMTRRLAAMLDDASVTDAEALALVAFFAEELPSLIDEMDVDALADMIERALGAAALVGARSSLERRGYTLYSAAPAAWVVFAPLAEALASLDARSPLAVALSSAQWERVPAALRSRAVFSAHVASARFLSGFAERIRRRLAWERDAASGRLMDRSVFVAEMRQVAIEEGLGWASFEEGAGDLRNVRSQRRLALIYDMQTRQATEMARAKMDMDPDVLDAYPAYRFARVETRDEERQDWPQRWRTAAAGVGFQGVDRGGSMVALKTSPVWAALSRFGTPWPPYDWGSGMGRVDVSRGEATAMGLLLGPADRVEPVSLDPYTGAELSIAEVEPRLQMWLRERLGDMVGPVGDGLSLALRSPGVE